MNGWRCKASGANYLQGIKRGENIVVLKEGLADNQIRINMNKHI